MLRSYAKEASEDKGFKFPIFAHPDFTPSPTDVRFIIGKCEHWACPIGDENLS